MNIYTDSKGCLELYGRTNDIPDIVKTIKESSEQTIKVHNSHETFYGFEFCTQLEEEISKQGLDVEFAITGYDHIEGFAQDFIITKK